MAFVELGRHFAPLSKDQEASLEVSIGLGRKYGGWLNWDELNAHRRVVILAEALSGKTAELEHQVSVLRDQGKFAFYLRVEDLAGGDFVSAHEEGEAENFQRWKGDVSSDAWFLLDSVDEARLQGKHFKRALQTLRSGIGMANIHRAFIVVTCRASDWRGTADRDLFEQLLATPQTSAQAHTTPELSAADRDAALLACVVERESSSSASKEKDEVAIAPEELLVVQLLPLADEQKTAMASANGVDGIEFMRAVELAGLDAFSERPGDILDLLSYWKEHGKFGSLSMMMESSILRKLREVDPERGPQHELSPQRSWEGAQRIAAALVLAKSFTIRASRQESDPTLSAGAIDGAKVLSDWSPKEVDALLRTGLFAPSTYGRIRFHHRASQEFLAARWFLELLTTNWPVAEAVHLFFSEPYGVKTVVPALLPVVAWLAQWSPELCSELVAREPVALIVHGDARSLPLAVKGDLLEAYARLNASGDLDADLVDPRAAWAFSDPALSGAIRKAWEANDRPRFRLTMLQLISEGQVRECVDLARVVALNQNGPYARVVATRVLAQCQDAAGLQGLADQVRNEPGGFGARIAPQIAVLLYPTHLSTDDLFALIAATPGGRRFSSDGFSHHLLTLYNAAPSRMEQMKFVERLVALVRDPVKAHEDPDDSRMRHADLVRGIVGIAVDEVRRTQGGELAPAPLELLMAVERSRESAHDSDALQNLATLVAESPRLNRQLMWADYKAARAEERRAIENFWQIGPYTGRKLWDIRAEDAGWLELDVESAVDDDHRIVAYSALLHIARAFGESREFADMLDRFAARSERAREQLHRHRDPPPPEKWLLDNERHQRKWEAKKKADAKWWLEYRDGLVQTPEDLDAPERVKTWDGGLQKLYQLHRWVTVYCHRSRRPGLSAWLDVGSVFSPGVAEHYKRAMEQCWRNVPPARPTITGPNQSTWLRVNELAVDGVELESLTRDEWPTHLAIDEVQTAAEHCIFSGKVKRASFTRLANAFPEIVNPMLIAGLDVEFRSGAFFDSILDAAAQPDSPLLASVVQDVFRRLEAQEPSNEQLLSKGLRILRKGRDLLPADAVKAMCERRVAEHVASGNDERAFQYLEVVARIDSEYVACVVTQQLNLSDGSDAAQQRAEKWVVAAFDGHFDGGFATPVLSRFSVAHVLELLTLMYRCSETLDDEEDDEDDEPSFGERTRQRASWARGVLLNDLVARPGHEAHAAVLELAKRVPEPFDSMNLKEVAHGKARKDGDLTAWTEAEVVVLGREQVAPVKNGFDLYRLVRGVLADIVFDLDHADVSTRQLLARAADEEEVQEWLVERMNEKSRGRFRCFRESEVADHNAPDVIVASTSAFAEVAIELKNANKGWTLPDLEVALLEQLAEDYLLPAHRRHGLLVVSLHSFRTWEPAPGESWRFEDVIEHLQERAESLTKNKAGSIEVCVFALNAYREEAGDKVENRKARAAKKTT